MRAAETGRDVVVAATQMFYIFVTPVMAWWFLGIAGIALWLAAAFVLIGASVVIWSAYQDWCAGKQCFRELVLRASLSPLTGPLRTVEVAVLTIRLCLSLSLATRTADTPVEGERIG